MEVIIGLAKKIFLHGNKVDGFNTTKGKVKLFLRTVSLETIMGTKFDKISKLDFENVTDFNLTK